MTVRKYEPEDFEQVARWGLAYGANYSPEQFPKVGFIVDGVAAYFLYQTDSACCWLENMIANKSVSFVKREDALKLIIDRILLEAKHLGFRVAYATTNRFTVALRAKAQGAKVEPNHLLLTLKLN